MREQELFAYLGISEINEIEECYEDKIFAHKQFFLNSVVMKKVFEQRLNRIEKEKKIFDELGYGSKESSFNFLLEEFPQSNEIITIHTHYQKLKNDLKLRLFSCDSYENIGYCVMKRLELEGLYSEYWNCEYDEEIEIASKENDEMLVLKIIREYQENGGRTFEDLKKNRNNPPELLLKEMKRLNLIRTKYL